MSYFHLSIAFLNYSFSVKQDALHLDYVLALKERRTLGEPAVRSTPQECCPVEAHIRMRIVCGHLIAKIFLFSLDRNEQNE